MLLEQQFQGKLQSSRIVFLGACRDAAEVTLFSKWCRYWSRRVYVDLRGEQQRRIEGIQEFSPELQGNLFANFRGLEGRQVEVVDVIAAQEPKAQGEGSDVACQLFCRISLKSVGVDPTDNILLASRKFNISEGAVVN